MPLRAEDFRVGPDYKRISESGHMDDDGMNALVAGIMRQAVHDLKNTTRWLNQHAPSDSRQYRSVLGLKRDAEKYFRSDWFRLFANCDGEKIIKALWGTA